jgi:phosphoribosyl-ATP pyrophosphohydrolase
MGKSAKKPPAAPSPEEAAPPAGKPRAKKAGPKKAVARKAEVKKAGAKKADVKKADVKKVGPKKVGPKKKAARRLAALAVPATIPAPPLAVGASAGVLDRLWAVVNDRRTADPEVSHSARLLRRGTAKVAQKFGEEAVECLIEAVSRNRDALVAESADVLYHLIVMWVDAGVRPDEVWAELQRREGVSGVAEKASRARALPLELGLGTTKIP